MTAAIAAVTVLVSLLILLTGNLPAAAIDGGFIPARAGAGSLADHGFALPAWLTPATATLVHGGVAHLLLNLVIMIFCGKQVERALGGASIALLYGIGAYAGALGHWAFSPGSILPMIGASGAVSAIVAAYALLFGERRTRAIGPFSADVLHVAWLAAAWIGIQLLMGVAGFAGASVAIGAHIGGFAAGLVLTRPLLRWHYRHA
ncbi:rhomboid family intramembrane serine protease [Sphingomonas rubra]|uniref:Membrane associated serine protease, rhomboid family n=1 Tax=Sphingomonas rubra TaxID=634430 RepID=A0A1I5RYL3_9SPHN|nr:rhomboid family intramembrane serine protease [Sphingomonas rubra]SFP63595.1 Membrane associated serine protease, rhomboid family [Sphingomonas rubra]